MKSGFVNIFGKPNAGKSTLLNALIGEKLAIVSSKVQTTRHRIKGILTEPNRYQIIFSDTPGIIANPTYKLHEKMMMQVKSALEDADIALLMLDIKDDWQEALSLFQQLKLKVKCFVLLNKIDQVKPQQVSEAIQFFTGANIAKEVLPISALTNGGIKELIEKVIEYLPEGAPFYSEDDLSDLPTKFFVSELIREKVYELYGDEIPYHTAVMVNEFKKKATLIKIQADIIVQRESQKGIILGEQGKMIKQLGTRARKDIEAFLDAKVFLQLFVKVRPKWRDNELQLKEYGY